MVSQIPQLSKSRAQRSICPGVTRSASSTNAHSIRASYQPVAQSAAASSWSLPSCLPSCWIVPTGTPYAFGAVIP